MDRSLSSLFDQVQGTFENLPYWAWETRNWWEVYKRKLTLSTLFEWSLVHLFTVATWKWNKVLFTFLFTTLCSLSKKSFTDIALLLEVSEQRRVSRKSSKLSRSEGSSYNLLLFCSRTLQSAERYCRWKLFYRPVVFLNVSCKFLLETHRFCYVFSNVQRMRTLQSV